MDAVILIGLQGAGKTTFFEQRFVPSHLRISLDQLKTRPREIKAIQDATREGRDFVVDNTNPTVAERAKYIQLARAARYRVSGYYFEPDIRGCLERNARRIGKARIPVAGLFRTRKRLQPPSLAEGFDLLYRVQVDAERGFSVAAWEAETPPLPLRSL